MPPPSSKPGVKSSSNAPKRSSSPAGRSRSSSGASSASAAAKKGSSSTSSSSSSGVGGGSSSGSTSTAVGTLGSYTKLRAVGKGSFGQIWLVRHTQKGGEPVVLKEVHLKKLSANEVKAQKREIEVLKKLQHPNIIAFVNTFEVTGVVALLLEYASGGDLDTAIEKKKTEGGVRFPESLIRKLATQLASALMYLHTSAKLLHRDVKPANVFMTADGDVKLGDFGLCASLSDKPTGGSEPVGTPLYMSPEILAGKPYDASADAWAFGCTLYEAMALQTPWLALVDDGFGGINGGMAGLLKCVTTKSLETDALKVANGGNFPPMLADAVAGLLVREPAKRLTLARLIEQLDEKPAIPASWGLSAEAAAAMGMVNIS